jgi:glycosyltransferase involved in cell wall biosynthesis
VKPTLTVVQAPPDARMLGVVVPVFNEELNVGAIVERLKAVLDGEVAAGHLSDWSILFVDDGSRDGTMAAIRAITAAEPRVSAIGFSRNFGKEIALAAGLDHVTGDAVVMIDADLQHPPETIPAFVARWRDGYDMVYGQRVDRATDGRVYSGFAARFYRVFERFGEMPLPEGAGDFRLLSRRVVETLKRMPERARFSKGLYAWVGYRSIGVPYQVAPRLHGTTKWNYPKLFRFAFDGITSFSTVPLKLATWSGLVISALAFLYALVTILRTIVFGSDVPGFPTLAVSVMFFSGIQLLSLGIIGEYVGRIFAEVKGRPLYIVAETVGADVSADTAGDRREEREAGR